MRTRKFPIFGFLVSILTNTHLRRLSARNGIVYSARSVTIPATTSGFNRPIYATRTGRTHRNTSLITCIQLHGLYKRRGKTQAYFESL